MFADLIATCNIVFGLLHRRSPIMPRLFDGLGDAVFDVGGYYVLPLSCKVGVSKYSPISSSQNVVPRPVSTLGICSAHFVVSHQRAERLRFIVPLSLYFVFFWLVKVEY